MLNRAVSFAAGPDWMSLFGSAAMILLPTGNLRPELVRSFSFKLRTACIHVYAPCIVIHAFVLAMEACEPVAHMSVAFAARSSMGGEGMPVGMRSLSSAEEHRVTCACLCSAVPRRDLMAPDRPLHACARRGGSSHGGRQHGPAPDHSPHGPRLHSPAARRH